MAALFNVAKTKTKVGLQKGKSKLSLRSGQPKPASPSGRLSAKARGSPTRGLDQKNAKDSQTPSRSPQTVNLGSQSLGRPKGLPSSKPLGSITVRQRGSPTSSPQRESSAISPQSLPVAGSSQRSAGLEGSTTVRPFTTPSARARGSSSTTPRVSSSFKSTQGTAKGRQGPESQSSPRPSLGVRVVAKGRPFESKSGNVRAVRLGVSSRPAAAVGSTQPATTASPVRGTGVPRPPQPTLPVASRGSPEPSASIRPAGGGQGVLEQLLSIAGQSGKNPVQSLPSRSSSSISGASADSVRTSSASSRRRPALKVLSRARSQLPGSREGQNDDKPQKETPRASLAADRPKISGASLLDSVNQVPRAFSKARAQTGAKTAPQISTPPETFAATERPQAPVVREPDAVRGAAPPRPRGPDIIRNKGQARPRGIEVKSKSNRVAYSEKKKNHDYEDDAQVLQKPSVYGCKHLCGTLIYDVYKLLGGKVCDC